MLMHLEIISTPPANRQDNTFLWMGLACMTNAGPKRKKEKKKTQTFSIMLIKYANGSGANRKDYFYSERAPSPSP